MLCLMAVISSVQEKSYDLGGVIYMHVSRIIWTEKLENVLKQLG